MRAITTTRDLDVDAGTAWQVLTDFPHVGDWNPFVRRIEGEPAVGTRLRVQLQLPGRRAMTLRPRVTEVVSGRVLEWLGSLGVNGLFDGRHRFELEPLDGGRTRLHHGETFTGVFVPVLWRGIADSTAEGFESFNRGFAERCREVAGRA